MKALDSFANVVLVISFFFYFQHDVKLGFIIFLLKYPRVLLIEAQAKPLAPFPLKVTALTVLTLEQFYCEIHCNRTKTVQKNWAGY